MIPSARDHSPFESYATGGLGGVPDLIIAHGRNQMLTTYPAAAREEPLHATRKVLWIDLLDPTDEEKASVETKFGLELPSRRELSEVESSSRISEKDGVLFLSMPI